MSPRSRRALLGAGTALLLAVGLGSWRTCSRRNVPELSAGPSSARPADGVETSIEVSGCVAIVIGSVCERPADGVLRVWVSAPADAVTFATASAPVGVEGVAEVSGGALHRVVVPRNANELRVLSRTGSTLRVVRLADRSAPDWVDRARALRQSGDIDGASALVLDHEASSNEADRAFAQGLRARLLLSAGKAEASFPIFRESAGLHRKLGRISDAADDRFALAFALNQRSHRYAEARAVLDEVHADVAEYADGRVREAYYRGTLATETGDARGALQHLSDASEHAQRLGLAQLERNARNAYALQLALVGRADEALELLTVLDRQVAISADASACERAEVAINTGFGALLVNEHRARDPASETKLVDALEPLERALALCTDRCKDRYLRTAALGNLALAAVQHGDLPRARRRLAEARAGIDGARAVEILFWHEVDGRIALAAHEDARALAAFEEEARRARETVSFEAEWRARVGKGKALERLGRNEQALDEYRAAEQLVTTSSVLVPLGEGRGTLRKGGCGGGS